MTDHEPFNGEVLMLDVEQIKEDLKILKVSSKMSRTILFALQTASKYDKNKVTYVSFVVSLQKCKLRKFEDVVKIEKFILDRCYQEKNMRICVTTNHFLRYTWSLFEFHTKCTI